MFNPMLADPADFGIKNEESCEFTCFSGVHVVSDGSVVNFETSGQSSSESLGSAHTLAVSKADSLKIFPNVRLFPLLELIVVRWRFLDVTAKKMILMDSMGFKNMILNVGYYMIVNVDYYM